MVIDRLFQNISKSHEILVFGTEYKVTIANQIERFAELFVNGLLLLYHLERLAETFFTYYDAFIHLESCTNIRATAKELKVPEKMFTAFLVRKRYLYRAPSGSLMPYAKAADDGLFFVKDYIAVNGHQGVYTLVTPKGKALFLSMLGEIA